jgi:hypothetical protein
MKKILFTAVLFVSLTCFVPAQVNDGAFFSGSFGGFENGNSTNQLRPGYVPSVVLSAGFGLPIIDRVYLYTKLSYISRTNYTAEENYSFIQPDLTTINELVLANASFSQLLFNGGLQYNIYITDDITLGLNSGLTYVLVNHKASLPNGAVLQQIDDIGVFGVFGGVSLEKYVEDSNVSIFGEAQYNYVKKNMIYFRDKFSGMNFTVGARYYLN